MKKLGLWITLFFVSVFIARSAYAIWIWTPESGKWINPKYAVKDTPAEQLEWALEFYNSQDYDRAIAEFRKLIRHYPKSYQASEAQYYLGKCWEEKGDLYRAFLEYQKVIDIYAFSQRMDEIIEKEYEIAERFLKGEKRKLWGVSIPVIENPAIEIFRKVVENAPFGKYAALAQYKVGLSLKATGEFDLARDEFQKVVDRYPDSEWAEAAKFQIALCASRSSLRPDYDQTQTREARERFEKFLKAHPDAELSQEAQGRLNELVNKEAESAYNVAVFYERQKKIEAAKVYYRWLLNDYPQTRWADKAREKLRELDNQ
jgi:outer membrane protein assembly factor BamD